MTKAQERTVLWLISEGMHLRPSGDELGRICLAHGKRGNGDLAHWLWVGARGGVYGFNTLSPSATIQRQKKNDPPADWVPTPEARAALIAQQRELTLKDQERRLRAKAVPFEGLQALSDHLLSGGPFPAVIAIGDAVYYGGGGGTLSPASAFLSGRPLAVEWHSVHQGSPSIWAIFRLRFDRFGNPPEFEMRVLYAAEGRFGSPDEVAQVCEKWEAEKNA